ncbi:MAG: RimK family alpha-L-glutamate ligase [Saprospiraceae bacterium]|nr:RimK family alpha-L-glutamate ligase [Candidatus Opimibacter skivensis]
MRILILSRSPILYSTHSLVMAARRRGHSVRVVDHLQCDLTILSGKLGVRFQNEFIGRPDAVIPRIGSSVTSYGAAVVRQFEMMGVFTVVTTEALLRSRDKRTALQYLAANHLPVPDSVFTAMPDNVDSSLRILGEEYPIVIKMLNSTQGQGVILGESYSASLSVAEAFIRLKEEILLQRFIGESKGKDVRVFIVGGQVVAAMERSAQNGEFRSNLHRGASSHKIRITSEEEEIALRAAQLMGLEVAGVDILRSNAGPLILEVNASPGLEGIEGTTGVDIASQIIRFVETNAKPVPVKVV